MRTTESLFTEYFLPLYPPSAASDLARARREDRNPAGNPHIVAKLTDTASTFVRMAPLVLGKDPKLDFTDESVHRLSHALTLELREAFAQTGAAGTPASELFNFVVHGAAYVGQCIVNNHGGTWAVREPLWESMVHLKSRAGEGDLAVFHWWLKSLADDALTGKVSTLADRYRALVEVPTQDPTALPIIAPADRKLVRLAKVRYDNLFKYLKANLPELKDLGADFPSPERFAEFGLKWLDFHLVGDGRMLVMFGLGEKGAHLFWLTKDGFEKSAFYPCDSFPEPLLRQKPETLEIILSIEKSQRLHEVLWWGP